MEKGIVTINPTAGNGVIRKSIPALERAIREHPGWKCFVPTHESELDPILHSMLSEGTPIVVIVGGDGTNHQVFTAMHKAGGDGFLASRSFVFTNGGTMNFVARSLAVDESPTQHLDRVFQGSVRMKRLQLLRFDGVTPYPLLGTFAGFGAAAAVLGKYRQSAGGRFHIMQWIARGIAAAMAPTLSQEVASFLAPTVCEVVVDGSLVLHSLIGAVVSTISEFKLRFPIVPHVRPFHNDLSPGTFGIVASDHSPRTLAVGIQRLWRGTWDASDPHVVNRPAREVVISGLHGAVDVDGDEYYSESGNIRISCGPVISILV